MSSPDRLNSYSCPTMITSLYRSWRQVTRDKATNMARALSNVSSAIIFSAIFWRMRGSQATIQDRLGLLQVRA